MKKTLMLIGAVAVAGMTQAAVLQWGSAQVQDTQSPDGELFAGVEYAQAGVDMYLVYCGADDVFGGLTSDNGIDLIWGGVDDVIADSYTTTITDYNNGNFYVNLDPVGLTTWSPNAATWESMNDYTFALVSVYDDGTDLWWGSYVGNAYNFSTSSGDSGTGYLTPATFDVSGNGQVVPEPATMGLFGLGALGAWFIRRSKKAQEEEEV